MHGRAMEEAHHPAVDHGWLLGQVGCACYPLHGVTSTAGACKPSLRASRFISFLSLAVSVAAALADATAAAAAAMAASDAGKIC